MRPDTLKAIHAAAKAAGIPKYKTIPLQELIFKLPEDVRKTLKLEKFGADKMKAHGGPVKKYAKGSSVRKATRYS